VLAQKSEKNEKGIRLKSESTVRIKIVQEVIYNKIYFLCFLKYGI